MSSEKVNKFVRNEMEKYFRSDKWITLYIDDDDDKGDDNNNDNVDLRSSCAEILVVL